MGAFFSVIFGQLWREWLILGLALIILVLGMIIYNRGYDNCENAAKAAEAAARQEEQVKALTEANSYQAQAAKLLTEEKTKSNNLQVKINALQKQPHVTCAIAPAAIKLYDSEISR